MDGSFLERRPVIRSVLEFNASGFVASQPVSGLGAQTAARAGVGTLVLTHQIPTPGIGTADEWIAAAREHFAGDIVFGEDLASIAI